MKYAITGGIGSGKTFVCELLQQRGIQVFDCDKSAKHLMNTSLELKNSIKKLIGEQAYIGEKINKAVVAQFILESKINMQTLNSLIHPMVAKHFSDSKLSFIESAILFESGFDKLVDKVICVTAPLQTRINRIIKRDNITEEKALEWINNQMTQEEKMLKSNYIIENDGIKNLDKQLNKILLNI